MPPRQRLPRRRSLPHDVPHWVDPSWELYFITVNCGDRDRNHLCVAGVAAELFSSIRFQNEARLWHCRLCLLMPDHLHALISFVNRDKPLAQTVADWKRWTSRKMGVQWQSDHFEHRIRSDHEEVSKAQYILQNPVRRGLVRHPEDWPYVWRPGQ
jgi:REP element-mobilizing transposase RayT